MTWKWLTTTAEFAAIQPAWEAGLRASNSRNPALLPEFILVWARRFVAEGALRIFVLYDRLGIVGGLPLYQCRWPGLLAWPVLRPIGVDSADLTDAFFCVTREVFLDRLAVALRQLRGWRFLYLPLVRDLCESSGALPGPRCLSGMRIATEPAGSSARIQLSGTPAIYWSRRGARLRGNIRYYERRAAARGRVRLERYCSTDKIRALMELHVEWLAPRSVFTAHAQREWGPFVLELVGALARRGGLEAHVLWIGEAIAALSVWLRADNWLHGLWFSHDPDFAGVSPGTLLLHRFIDWSWQNQIDGIEFTCDEGFSWKRRWANEFQPMYRLHWFHPGVYGNLLARLHGRRLAAQQAMG